jgi:hypothetical protein
MAWGSRTWNSFSASPLRLDREMATVMGPSGSESELLSKARQAEEQATKVKDVRKAECWRRVADIYRQLAEVARRERHPG